MDITLVNNISKVAELLSLTNIVRTALNLGIVQVGTVHAGGYWYKYDEAIHAKNSKLTQGAY